MNAILTTENTRLQPFSITPKIIELMQVIVDLQSAGKATVFINISGHVTLFECRVYMPCWEPDMDVTHQDQFYFEWSTDDSIRALIDKYRNL